MIMMIMIIVMMTVVIMMMRILMMIMMITSKTMMVVMMIIMMMMTYFQEKQVAVIGQCRAIYDYAGNMYDELTIKYGDVINIHDKQEDGWWLGECQGLIGIFPATYVELV